MKKIYVTVLVCVVTNLIFSQANKQKSTLIFKDGSTLNCYARISGTNIRYVEKNIRDSELVVNYETLSGIKIYMNDNLIELYYKKEVGKSIPKLMEKTITGKINLYRIQDVYETSIGFSSNPNYFARKSASTVYFLDSKTNTDEVIRLAEKFEENAKNYFSDCKLLTDQIGNDNFRKKDLFKMVLFYNENCGK